MTSTHCIHCNARLRIPDGAVGREVKCPKCKLPFAVPSVETVAADFLLEGNGPTLPAPKEEGQKDQWWVSLQQPVQAVQEEPSEPPSPPTVVPAVEPRRAVPQTTGTASWTGGSASQSVPIGATILLLIGFGLLLAAFITNIGVNDGDRRQGRIDDSRWELNANFGKYDTPYSKPGDRTLVYVLSCVGAFFIGLGILSWTIETKSRPPVPVSQLRPLSQPQAVPRASLSDAASKEETTEPRKLAIGFGILPMVVAFIVPMVVVFVVIILLGLLMLAGLK